MQSIVLPDADSARDCLPALPAADAETGGADELAPSWLPRRNRLLRLLERVMLAVEQPINRLVGVPQLNPFYYTGPIAVFLLGVVFLTGLFLVLFFQVGFDVSYLFVARMEGQPLARLVRAVHRYASDALIVVTLIHAFRLFVMDRLHGPRWLAWVSGVAMLAAVWMAGVTGYWLIWDERALAITLAFDHILQRGASSVLNLAAADQKGNDWIFIMIILGAHLALSALIGVGMWIHLARLQRPRWLLQRHWLIGLTVVLLGVAIVAPIGMLPKAALTRAPTTFPIDLLYLFFLPAAYSPTLNAAWLWLGALTLLVILGALPWLSFSRRHSLHITIDKAACTGCTVCATDCPYGAITLEPRTDGKHKFIAVEHPARCVGCGICLGACDSYAITLGPLSTNALWHAILARLARASASKDGGGLRPRLILTCGRHAVHHPIDDQQAKVIALPCVGAVHPDVVGMASELWGAEVRIVGCPPDDCANREGNLWEEQRLTGKRLPHLKREFAQARIGMLWLPPDEFGRGMTLPLTDARVGTGHQPALTWRHFIPAFGLLALVLLVQIGLSNVPFHP